MGEGKPTGFCPEGGERNTSRLWRKERSTKKEDRTFTSAAVRGHESLREKERTPQEEKKDCIRWLSREFKGQGKRGKCAKGRKKRGQESATLWKCWIFSALGNHRRFPLKRAGNSGKKRRVRFLLAVKERAPRACARPGGQNLRRKMIHPQEGEVRACESPCSLQGRRGGGLATFPHQGVFARPEKRRRKRPAFQPGGKVGKGFVSAVKKPALSICRKKKIGAAQKGVRRVQGGRPFGLAEGRRLTSSMTP